RLALRRHPLRRRRLTRRRLHLLEQCRPCASRAPHHEISAWSCSAGTGPAGTPELWGPRPESAWPEGLAARPQHQTARPGDSPATRQRPAYRHRCPAIHRYAAPPGALLHPEPPGLRPAARPTSLPHRQRPIWQLSGWRCRLPRGEPSKTKLETWSPPALARFPAHGAWPAAMPCPDLRLRGWQGLPRHYATWLPCARVWHRLSPC